MQHAHERAESAADLGGLPVALRVGARHNASGCDERGDKRGRTCAGSRRAAVALAAHRRRQAGEQVLSAAAAHRARVALAGAGGDRCGFGGCGGGGGGGGSPGEGGQNSQQTGANDRELWGRKWGWRAGGARGGRGRRGCDGKRGRCKFLGEHRAGGAGAGACHRCGEPRAAAPTSSTSRCSR